MPKLRPAPLRLVPSTPHPTKLRLRAFWRAILASRDGGPSEEELMDEARRTGLVAAVHALSVEGGHSANGEADVLHVIRWAHKGEDPWGKGEFPDGL